MKRIIVGTAGHVDHGKTRLIEALTGIDCDRLEEEKSRGITIDLGFAFLRQKDVQIGFVDVPGHHKFLHNALAGLGAVRILLLVVAVDEGVAEQTREHLALASLLGVPRLVVALSKADLVDEEIAELAELEVTELLESSPFRGAPVVMTSAEDGRGIEELKDLLVAEASDSLEVDLSDGPIRLPVDRAFHLKGLGVVVTGTLIRGSIGQGDELELQPGGERLRVRGIQVHGEDREVAKAGERTSLRLAGADLPDLPRGKQIVRPDSQNLSSRFVAEASLLEVAPKALKGWQDVRLHHLADEVMGRIRCLGDSPMEPGEQGWVEVLLERPIPVIRGDRFIFRRPSPPLSLGGGEVMDPSWLPRGPKARARALPQLKDLENLLRFWAAEAGVGGITAKSVAQRLGWADNQAEEHLGQLVGEQHLIRGKADRGGEVRFIHPGVVKKTAEGASAFLKKWFKAHRLEESMPKAEFIAEVLGSRGALLAGSYLNWWQAEGRVRIEGDSVGPPGRKAELKPEESRLAAEIVKTMDEEGLAPPSPPELARRLGASPAIFDGVMEYCRRQGKVIRLPGGLLVSAKVINAVVEALEESGWDRFGVPQFKEHFSLSRKWAIPVLEHLDSRGVTRRMGNERQIVSPRSDS